MRPLLLLLLLLAGCPTGQGTSKTERSTKASPAITVSLLRTDLGLGDGELVRDADVALAELARQGKIDYVPAGDLPEQLKTEGGTGDVGLPEAGQGAGPPSAGTMTVDQAAALAQELPDCDLIVVSGPLAARPVVERLRSDNLKAGALLLLDQEGPPFDANGLDVPPLQITYDIRAAAYLLGVAAGTSSRSQAFVAFTSEYDPNADAFLKHIEDGVHHYMRGGNIYHERLTPDAENLVSPEEFSRALARLLQGLQCDHFFVALGRATPSILYALSTNPTRGYALGGYGDFRQVRPARIMGCVVKRPSVALHRLLGGKVSIAAVLEAAEDESVLRLNMEDGGVELTDLSAYKNFNPDAGDIEEAVKRVKAEIESGVLELVD